MDRLEKAIADGNYEILRELNPNEIEHFDSISVLIRAQEDAFKVAFNYYMNKRSDTTQKLEQFYETLSGKSRFDQSRGTMGVVWVEGKVCLIKVDGE